MRYSCHPDKSIRSSIRDNDRCHSEYSFTALANIISLSDVSMKPAHFDFATWTWPTLWSWQLDGSPWPSVCTSGMVFTDYEKVVWAQSSVHATSLNPNYPARNQLNQKNSFFWQDNRNGFQYEEYKRTYNFECVIKQCLNCASSPNLIALPAIFSKFVLCGSGTLETKFWTNLHFKAWPCSPFRTQRGLFYGQARFLFRQESRVQEDRLIFLLPQNYSCHFGLSANRSLFLSPQWCGMMQCATVQCSVLQCVAVCCSVLQCAA